MASDVNTIFGQVIAFLSSSGLMPYVVAGLAMTLIVGFLKGILGND